MVNARNLVMILSLSGAAALGQQNFSSLELHAAQSEAKQAQIELLWGTGTYSAKAYTDGIILTQPIKVDDNNYTADITYRGKVGNDGRLTEWEVMATAYAKSDPSKPDSRLYRSGSLRPDGTFNLSPVKADPIGPGYNLISTAFGLNLLTSVQLATNDARTYWIKDVTAKYLSLSKSGKMPDR